MNPQDMERLKAVLEVLPTEPCKCENCNYTLVTWWDIVGTDYSLACCFGRLFFTKKPIYIMPSWANHSSYVSFEEVLDSLSKEIQEKIIFNLDLFRGG